MIQKHSTIAGHSIKDNSKGQKIAAALYLVTAHLSDNDPLKNTLRTHAVTLLGTSSTEASAGLARTISDLLSVAALARLISEKNASIITLELRHFLAVAETAHDTVTATLEMHFGQVSPTSSIPYGTHRLNTFKKTQATFASLGQSPSERTSESTNTIREGSASAAKPAAKTERQAHILSFINERKSAGIKDIAMLFPETSEKTIQRELGTLVASGRITKRGAKRWSVYMAI
ncbi:MAG TPA: hypothetical protein VGE18_00200 [Candidatus Paceibacterota bacterium]